MRAIMCVVLVGYGCGQPELAPSARMPGAAPAAAAERIAPAPPGLRLPDGVAPVEYDLALDLDPGRDSFTGRVAITIAVSQPTAQIWLHAVDLSVARAQLVTAGGAEPVALLAGGEPWQMRGFALPRTVGAAGPETITLAIDYTGRARDMTRSYGKEEEGLFRRRAGGRWYLYSQSESIFARKIVPCFDEPRWKPAWRVTAIVPGGVVALGNAPVAQDTTLRKGHEVRFARIPAMASYLLAIAVGPFELIDIGKLGRNLIPVRVAAFKGQIKADHFATRVVPQIIGVLETYLDSALPLPKLDLVAVPDFFAMENLGLITFDAGVLLGGRELVSTAGHELAHQWFGNLVTPAWWDHVWLSEAFATWMQERIKDALREPSTPIGTHFARASALSADEEVDVEPIVHPIAASDDIEPAFSAIAYRKGAAVLAEFERFVGEDRFRAAIRGYLAAHAGTSVTSQAFVDALSAATSPEIGAALASNLVHAGTPVVDLELRCAAGTAPSARRAATVIASARDGVSVPVCVRFPVSAGATDQACFLAGAHTEHRLPDGIGCPAWLIGNAGGRGYYETAWRGAPPHPPFGLLGPEERLARGDDAAAAVQRGGLTVTDALAEISAMALLRDPYADLSAITIARAIDPLVDDGARPAWAAWLAKRFAERLTKGALSTPRSAVGEALRTRVVTLARPAIDAATVAAARAALERMPGGLGGVDGRAYEPVLLRIAAGHDAEPLFDRIVRSASVAGNADRRGDLLAGLGEFPPAFAPRLVDLAVGGRFTAAELWPPLRWMLTRNETRNSAWRAIHERIAKLFEALPANRRRYLIEATDGLCDAAARAEVASDFTPRLAAIPGGKRALAHALGAIDRCIARRTAAGDIAGALTAL